MTGHKFRRPDKDRHTFKQLVKRVKYNDDAGLIERVGINHRGKVGNIKSTGYMRIKIDGMTDAEYEILYKSAKQADDNLVSIENYDEIIARNQELKKMLMHMKCGPTI